MDDKELLSDLPMLMAMFEPGMTLSSITALINSGDKKYLTGLQMRLADSKSGTKLDLVEIGSEGVEWISEKKEFPKPIDRISIVNDEIGICDVIVYDGNDGIR